jgi:hypothetical protein
MEYIHLVRATEGLSPEGPCRAIRVLQDTESFYDYPRYRDAVQILQLWLRSLSCDAFPGQFTDAFQLTGEGLFNLCSVNDLCDTAILQQIARPFVDYLEGILFRDLLLGEYRVIGINITYVSQLPFALWLIRSIRRLLPETYIVCGGTEVSDLWKYCVLRESFARLFEGADGCVIGEGESSFFRILDAVSDGSRPRAIPNLVCLGESNEAIMPPEIRYENLDCLPTPQYDLMSANPYFSPHLLVYYSPTRGCYWNKCTFCDYGLNFGTPTSPWRQRNIELVLQDLTQISRLTPYVYLSVDVLSPSAILRLAEALVQSAVQIYWSAEMRLESYFSQERCQLLHQSGCVSVSVGFESGCQRILDRIRKGTRLDQIKLALGNLADAEIAVQMMGFTDFPTETYDEAIQSVSYLQNTRDLWATAALGEFQLTPGSIIAQYPQDFSLVDVRPFSSDDIARRLFFRTSGGPSKKALENEAIEREKKSLSTTEFERPFVGGIDSAHTIFYFARFGPRFPERLMQRVPGTTAGLVDDAVPGLRGRVIFEESYNLTECFDSEDLAALHIRMRRQYGQSLDSSCVVECLDGEKRSISAVSARNVYVLRLDGAIIPCPLELFEFLRRVDGKRTIEQIFDDLEHGNARGMWLYALIVRGMANLGVLVPEPNKK